MNEASTILLIGYGNPGRLDDGLGPALADAIEAKRIPGVTVDSNYQLSVEDADAIARHNIVLFVDADVQGREPFWFGRVEPKKEVSFSSHSISPEALMDMANNLLEGETRGYILGIRGYEFNEFGERLSAKASANLAAAVQFVEKAIAEKEFDQYTSVYKNA
ncbi:MAG: hydrogenase maturation protease [Deltaproteobacteria bacterium]|nr:hydrogenase maturation protease [Deltaproteobacteria bacterium]MBN2670491.1 hydrogenase maturation protease [Deltaproteobacteria bacterium]